MTIRKRGFTLVESMFAMIILLVGGLGTLGTIIYSRTAMELEKQRIAAVSFCRQYLEDAVSLASMPAERNKDIDRFSSASSAGIIKGSVAVYFFPMNADGTVKWSSPYNVAIAPDGEPVMARCIVTWTPVGRMSRKQSVSMDTLIRAGVKP